MLQRLHIPFGVILLRHTRDLLKIALPPTLQHLLIQAGHVRKQKRQAQLLCMYQLRDLGVEIVHLIADRFSSKAPPAM